MAINHTTPFTYWIRSCKIDEVYTFLRNCNYGVANGSLQYQVGRYINTHTQDNSMTTIVSAAQMGVEYRPYYTCSRHYMIWYDYDVIKVGHLFESINKIGLTKRLEVSIRIWVNTCTVNVDVGQPDTTNLKNKLTTANNTFSNTSPLMIKETQ